VTPFRQHQEVAVVEHDDSTRQPREGGKVHYATVTDVTKAYIIVSYHDRTVFGGKRDQFWNGSGWRAWDGWFRWRLVHVCTRCERPVLGTPVTSPGDQAGRLYCTDGCRVADSESAQEQRYPSGVAT
jgi:hypothetical protein